MIINHKHDMFDKYIYHLRKYVGNLMTHDLEIFINLILKYKDLNIFIKYITYLSNNIDIFYDTYDIIKKHKKENNNLNKKIKIYEKFEIFVTYEEFYIKLINSLYEKYNGWEKYKSIKIENILNHLKTNKYIKFVEIKN